MRVRFLLGALICLGCLADAALATPILVSDRFGVLHSVDSTNGDLTTIGPMHLPSGATNIRMADIAIDSNGNLFGVGIELPWLWSIDSTTAEVSRIGLPASGILGLAFDSGGTLYATSSDERLYEVDPATGASTPIGQIREGAVIYRQIEDIAFDSNGVLYGVGGTGGSTSLSFISIDPATAAATEIRRSSIANPAFRLGVAFDDDDDLIVATRQTTLWSLDTGTGDPTFISLTVEAYGATSNIFGSSGPEPAPEPGTLSLLGLALTVGGLARRRRQAA